MAEYIIENGMEQIIDGEFKSEPVPVLTMFFDFFDLAGDKTERYTHDVLMDIISGNISIEEAMEEKPLLRLVRWNKNKEIQENGASMIRDMSMSGHDCLMDLLKEHHDYNINKLSRKKDEKESIYKTFLCRALSGSKAEGDFLQHIDIRMDITTVDTLSGFIVAGLEYIENQTVCVGTCNKCYAYYPIYRGGKSLVGERFCPKCRNTEYSQIAKENKKHDPFFPVYDVYRKLYKRWAQQYTVTKSINLKQRNKYIDIAEKQRDKFKREKNYNADEYVSVVTSMINEWDKKHPEGE